MSITNKLSLSAEVFLVTVEPDGELTDDSIEVLDLLNSIVGRRLRHLDGLTEDQKEDPLPWDDEDPQVLLISGPELSDTSQIPGLKRIIERGQEVGIMVLALKDYYLDSSTLSGYELLNAFLGSRDEEISRDIEEQERLF